MNSAKIGDLVRFYPNRPSPCEKLGVIVGFNKKGEGGQDFVHILCGSKIYVIMYYDVDFLKEGKK